MLLYDVKWASIFYRPDDGWSVTLISNFANCAMGSVHLIRPNS